LFQKTTGYIIIGNNMTESAKKLGLNMKRIRLEKGMTQGDICRKLKLDRAYVSNLESGKKNPTLATIEKLAKSLEVSINELIK
jgi:transcriptional regulator with XRE-family HTH domain